MIYEVLGSISAAILFYFLELCPSTVSADGVYEDTSSSVESLIRKIPKVTKSKLRTNKKTEQLCTSSPVPTVHDFKSLPDFDTKKKTSSLLSNEPICGQCMNVGIPIESCNKCINVQIKPSVVKESKKKIRKEATPSSKQEIIVQPPASSNKETKSKVEITTVIPSAREVQRPSLNKKKSRCQSG
ncbi:hypothetical protein M3Y94_01199000 [Aphelenchoides besseyi]|nr:hypothetical protein M3Y94_01199000 [Aphelenchoides besseyi]